MTGILFQGLLPGGSNSTRFSQTSQPSGSRRQERPSEQSSYQSFTVPGMTEEEQIRIATEESIRNNQARANLQNPQSNMDEILRRRLNFYSNR